MVALNWQLVPTCASPIERRLAAQRRVGERVDALFFERREHRGAQRAALDQRLAVVLGLALLRRIAQPERRVELRRDAGRDR